MAPKILFLDIETKPLKGWFWRLFDEQGGTAMLDEDWSILAWSAKWAHEDKLYYRDMRNIKDLDQDKKILKELWTLMDESDIIIGHNVKSFDIKRINTRFHKAGFPRPSPYRVIDTLIEARKHFAFTSNKLEYLAHFLGCTVKKLTKREFSGIVLWTECMKGNKKAWNEMELYNKRDVVVLEEVYYKLDPWINSINFSVYNNGNHVCSCGCKDVIKKGIETTNSGQYQRYKCKKCGKHYRAKENQLDKDARKNLKVGIK